MSNATHTQAEEIQAARAAHLRELFEPWSLRKLATRTGLSKGVLEYRFSGKAELSISDIEVLAPVIRMTPEELFIELLNVKAPTPKSEGRELPGLDSNQEPIGSKHANVTPLPAWHRKLTTNRPTAAIVSTFPKRSA